jgi:putative acetyltransferase
VSGFEYHSPEAAALTFRVLSDGDLADLAALWEASWQEAFPGIDFAARRDWFTGHMRALQSAGAVTVCAFDRDGHLQGFVTVDPATSYLDQLAVAPAAKGKGAARALLGEARRLSPGSLVLDVNEDNARARAFYEKEGFKKTGEGVNPRSGLKTWRMQWVKTP